MRVRVKAKPNAKRNKISDLGDNFFEISVKSPPIKGRANKEIVSLLAEYFKINQSQIKMIVGRSARLKLFDLDI